MLEHGRRVAEPSVAEVVAAGGGSATPATGVEVASLAAQGPAAGASGTGADPVWTGKGPVEEARASRRVGAGEAE